MRHVLILHGWSDSSESFRPLAAVLRRHGYQAIPLWLGDYVSRDDDVAIPDVAKRMEEVLQAMIATGRLAVPFDMVVHSTGALVARTWLTMFDASRGSRWLQRLVMLAPANYGSRLASLGKSMVGRLTRGIDNGFQTGTQMLDALELGSPFQWKLALADVLHDPTFTSSSTVAYGDAGCLPFVITGVKGYESLLRRALNEDGADGTVRAAAANLTSYGLTLDFARLPAAPASHWSRIGPLEAFAFRALADVDHGAIVAAGESVRPLILQALGCPMELRSYVELREDWFAATDRIARKNEPRLHQFFQLNTFVVDDLGQPVADHFIEFSGGSGESRDAALSVFQTDVMEHVHVNGTNGACRTFYIDRTDLFGKYYAGAAAGKPKDLRIRIWASAPGPNVAYFDPRASMSSGEFRIHLADDAHEEDRWLKRHCTHFLKIIIPRRPMEGVFRMNPFEA